MMPATLAFGSIGGWEWILIGVIALLIFGGRLPDVARSLGKSIVEFKKGVRDVQDDLDINARNEPPRTNRIEQKSDAARGADHH